MNSSFLHLITAQRCEEEEDEEKEEERNTSHQMVAGVPLPLRMADGGRGGSMSSPQKMTALDHSD